MKIHVLNFIDHNGKGQLRGFGSKTAAEAEQRRVKTLPQPASLIVGIESWDCEANKAGLIEAIERAASSVWK